MTPLLFSLVLSLTQSVQEINLIEDQRWGGVDGPGAVIGDVVSVSVFADGGFAVAQPPEPAVLLFGRDGEAVGSFGGTGRGPGEFRRVASAWSYGDTLLIPDLALGRTTVTVRDSVVAIWPGFEFSGTEGLLRSPVLGVFSDGSRLVQGRRLSRDSGRPVPLVRLAPDGGTIMDEVVRLNSASDLSAGVDASTGLTIYIPAAVSGSDLWVQVRGRDMVAVLNRPIPEEPGTGRAELTLYDPSGRRLRTIRFTDEAHPIPSAAYDREITYWTDRGVRGRPFPREQVGRAVEDAITRHPFNPLFDRMVAAEDGRIWLRRGSFGLDTAQWLVVELDGEISGQLSLPSGAEVKAATERWVWTVEQGAYDETYVVRYQRTAQ